ncbi:MAG: aminodeoxychorismate synthase component I, partial [Deltaproteobacteria bacterium]|nr:aminodeoxychorismate synthase component I [Deltaproteobacteria bacterium]
MSDFLPTVLLDSFAGGTFGTSWRFSGYLRTLATSKPSEVTGVLREVEDAAAGGLFAAGFIAYEAASALNPDLPSLAQLDGLPLVWFALFRERYSVDAGSGLSSPTRNEVILEPLINRDNYYRDICQIQDHIAEGHCYQINHTFQMKGYFKKDPVELYHSIGRGQRAPFCSYLDTGRFAILSASPELFFSLKDGVITTRPMKGTARRGRWAEEDRSAIEHLQNSPKERAENLMIVDLLRNDLGIVAKTGSVIVDALFEVESYPTVHQMTSTVTARVSPDTGLVDIFRALFPCGSVTGAPKRRSMQIIEKLEGEPRGVYCGAIGLVSPGGEALFSVAIRTLLLDQESAKISLGVGSGVTWDSAAEQEYLECLDKGAFVNRIEDDFRLIESLRLEEGVYTLLNRHLARMEASAKYFGFVFDRKPVQKALAAHAQKLPGLHKTRLLLSSDGGVEIFSEPLTDYNSAPLRIAVSDDRVDSPDILRYHKTTCREFFDKARSRHPECDELLFINERGELTEGSYHNLVVKLDGRILTPPLTCGLLPGVLREELLEK